MDDKTTAMSKLSKQQQMFVLEYLVDFNGTRAYMTAYDNKNRQSSASCASEALRRPNVREAIQETLKADFEPLDITRERILRELKNIAFSDLRDVSSWNEFGTELKSSRELTRNVSSAISEVTVSVRKEEGRDSEIVTSKVKMHNKISALEKLIDYTKLIDYAEDDEIELLV